MVKEAGRRRARVNEIYFFGVPLTPTVVTIRSGHVLALGHHHHLDRKGPESGVRGTVTRGQTTGFNLGILRLKGAHSGPKGAQMAESKGSSNARHKGLKAIS